MKVIVIGLGSMGKRRIRLLKKRNDVDFIIGVDSYSARRDECENEYNIRTAESINEAINDNIVDCAFVCTSPLSHSAIITECLNDNLHVFTEINLVSDRYNENMSLAKQRNKKLFLSSTFLYREETKYICEKVKEQHCRFNYIYHVGQYLPDWHPWENYEDFFVGDKKTNGCRELMAIELPWLIQTFGEISSVSSIHDKMTNLNLLYDDNYIINIEHANGNKGVLVIDVVSRLAVRNFELYSENFYLSWNGTPQGLMEFDLHTRRSKKIYLYDEVEHREGYASTIIENAYSHEINEFFEVINNNTNQIYGFEKDKVILNWIDKIEEL